MGVDGKRHVPAALPPWKRPGTHCFRGCVGPRAGLDGCGKLRPHLAFFYFWTPSLVLSLYAFRTCFFVLIVLACAFCLYYATHNTNILCLRRDSIPGPPSPQQVAISTALSRPIQRTGTLRWEKYKYTALSWNWFVSPEKESGHPSGCSLDGPTPRDNKGAVGGYCWSHPSGHVVSSEMVGRNNDSNAQWRLADINNDINVLMSSTRRP